jgi:adenylate cyclase
MDEIGLEARKRVAGAPKDYLARERISREQFAFKTKLGKSTVDKLLTGLFSEKTLAVVVSHTGLSLRSLLGHGNARSAAEEERAAVKPMDVLA